MEFKNDNKSFEDLYLKVQDVIKNVKIQKYVKEGQEIANEGISFFGGITGKNTLQLEKIRNVKLRIELLQSQKPEIKEEYELKDMMVDLYMCAISELGGNFTEEMKNLYDRIKEENTKEDISKENVYKLACKKIENSQSYLPIIHEEKTKGIFGNTRVQTEFYKLENKKLENEIVLERGKSQFKTFLYNNKIIPNNIKFNFRNNQV